MKITCNRIGGYNVHGIALSHGENEVDDQAWSEAAAKCLPAWLEAIQQGSPPDIVLHGETEIELSLPDELAKIEAVNSCDDLKQVEAMAEGELRVPVLEAIDRRLDQLIDNHYIEGPS